MPTSHSTNLSSESPISNALMVALKCAQAHQRRGYLEQQQQAFFTIKVKLKQLIISILDDSSVSRVMREATFSSPTVCPRSSPSSKNLSSLSSINTKSYLFLSLFSSFQK
ncbi:hypothetical protein HN51_059430 [Arachis hypogaea]